VNDTKEIFTARFQHYIKQYRFVQLFGRMSLVDAIYVLAGQIN